MKHTVRQYEKVIESLGAVRRKNVAEHDYSHVIATRIGLMYMRVDVKGGLLSLFCNFLDSTKKAKAVLGHWKYNLHQDKESDLSFERSIIGHLEYVTDKNSILFKKKAEILNNNKIN